MLVLSRKEEEMIVLGGHTVVKVVRVRGNAVRLMMIAPSDVRILRGELAGLSVDAAVVNAGASEQASPLATKQVSSDTGVATSSTASALLPSIDHLIDGGGLVLSRKKNEVILIGDDILLTVVELRGDKVRLGIEAPEEVSIHRLEVYLGIRNDQQQKPDAKTVAALKKQPTAPAEAIAG